MAKSADRIVVEYCPNCDTAIRFKRKPHRGQLVNCPECGDTLEVVSETPLELDWAFTDDSPDDNWKDVDEKDDSYMDYEDYQDYPDSN